MEYFFLKEDVEDLKSMTDYIKLFDYLGIPYRHRRDNIEFKCPIHQATHWGAAIYNERKNICTCFRCQEVFSPIDLIMKANNMSFYDAVVELASFNGVLENYKKEENSEKYPLRRLTDKEKKILGLDGKKVRTKKNDKGDLLNDKIITGYSWSKPDMGLYIELPDGYILIKKIK